MSKVNVNAYIHTRTIYNKTNIIYKKLHNMKNFNFLSNLLQRVSAMSGMRAETINYDGQPAVNRRANMTPVLRHCKASDARVAQEWYESGARVAQEWCESGASVVREWLQKSSARVAQGLRKSVRFAATILVLLWIGVGSAWGEATKQLELDFTNNTNWGFPTSKTTSSNSYTNGITITLAGGGSSNGYSYNASGYLAAGKNNFTLTFPAFSFTTTKIVVVGKSGASSKVTQNIYVESTAVSTSTTGATGTNTYNIDSSYQAAGTIYVFKVTNAYNTQITKIEIWGEAAATKTYHEWNGSSAFTTSSGGATLEEVPSLCDWAIEPYGWCSEEKYASSDYPTDKIWFKDVSWPAGKTDLYALYRVGSSPYYYYSTKPTIYTITYNLTNATKDDEFSYSCMSDMVDVLGTSNFYGYFKPADGYILDESCISVTMGGSPVSSSNYYWDYEYSYSGYDYTAEFYMENITGNVVVTVTAKEDVCTNSVTIETGSPTNCTISASAASVSTCSGTKQVTISVTPNSCYAAPVKASVTSTGTTATWVSGPTLNAGHYDYVYSFAENATGTATFNCSLSTKTTYTVSYAAGTVPSGGGSITGSQANDTKTCGTSMPLPGETFHTTGYTQTGWSKTDGGSQYAAVGGSYTDNAAQTFYPVWTVNSYTVTWKVNNTTYSAGGSASVNHGSHIATLPTAPSPASYCGDVFVGWTTDENYVHNTSPLYTTASGFPTASGAQVFYAVFADYTTE